MYAEGATPTKTGLKTFRLPLETLVTLEKEAEEKGITVNSLVSSIVTEHVDQRGIQHLGLVAIPRQLFTVLLGSAEEKTVEAELGPSFAGVWKSMMTYLFHDTSLGSAVKLTELLATRANTRMNLKVDGRDYSISFLHDYGPKFSAIFRTLLAELFGEYEIQPRFEVLSSSINVRFSAPAP